MIAVVISNIDRSSYLDMAESGKGGQTTYTTASGQRGQATVALRVHPLDTFAPVVGNPISLYDSTGHRIFGGLITEIVRTNEGNTLEVSYVCTCASFERMLDKHRIEPQSYFNQTAGAIFTGIFNSLPGETITLGSVEAGPAIPSAVYRHEVVTDIFNNLAAAAGFVWGVDPDTEQLYFRSPASVAAPFTLTGDPATGAGVLYDTIQWDTAQQDFRSRQYITVDWTAIATDTDLITGDGTATTFTLLATVDTVVAVTILGGPASNMGTAGGLAFNDGDTVTVSSVTYTFRALIDNLSPNEVLIGVDSATTMSNLAEAVNGGPNMGTDFSTGTAPNPDCTATSNNNTITVTAIITGTSGNSIPTTTTCTSGEFSWPTTTLSNGNDGPTRATVDGTVGTPANADTVTIDNVTYIWVTAVDNMQPYEVLIGASAAASASNLYEAILGSPTPGSGTTFSLPTTPHPTSVASLGSGGLLTVFAKIPGAAGNSIAVSATSGIAWATPTLTGGIPGPVIPQTVSGYTPGSPNTTDWQYSEGGNTITAPSVLAPGVIAMVTYYRLGADIIGVEDSGLAQSRAAVEGGSGIYQALIDVSSSTDPVATDKTAAILSAQSMIKNYGLLTQTLTFYSDSAGWQPGQSLTVALPPPFDSQLNGTWLTQQIQGTWLPGMNNWRSQVQAIAMTLAGMRSGSPVAIPRKATWQAMWQRLATVNPRRIKPAAAGTAAAAGASGGSTAPAAALGMMTFGLDDDTVGTNSVGKYGNIQFSGQPFIGSISCVTPPATANAQFDVLFSHDNGSTWTSIFLTSNPLVYPASAHGLVQFAVFANVTFAVGDLLRVDTIASGGAKGITGVIRWQ
jgi:hypothetical protein